MLKHKLHFHFIENIFSSLIQILSINESYISAILFIHNPKSSFAFFLSISVLHLLFNSVKGKRQDPDDAKNYISKLYEQQAINHDKREERKTLYPHFTCATDTNNIRRVFSDVKDTVLLKSLRDYGVI